MSNPPVDLTIVGGGVLGVFHAVAALERGLSVRLLERHAQPQGATVRNFGQIVPSGLDRNWQQFGRESLDIYSRLQNQLQVDLSMQKLGTIYIASNEGELRLLEELHQINRTQDYPSELWTPEQCLKRYSQLRRDYCKGGLFFAEEASVNPRLMIHRLLQWLREQPGCQVNCNTSVSRMEVSSRELVEVATTCGEVYSSSKAILCCGHEFQQLFPFLFRESELQLVKLQMLRLKPMQHIRIPGNVLTGQSIRRYESFSECPSWDEIKSLEVPDEFARNWGIHILFKQEQDGSIILGDSHEYANVVRGDELGFDLRDDINQYFIQAGAKIFDLPSWDIESSWFGVYSQTDDPTGIFTRTVDQNIHIVTGIGGKGMTSSAGYAKHHLKEIYHD